MVLQQSLCPILTEATELLQPQTQNTTSEHQLQSHPTARTELLLDPKVTTEKSPLVWEELHCETAEATIKPPETELVKETAGTASSSGIFMVLHISDDHDDDDYNKMKSEKEAGIVDLLSSFQTVSGTFDSSLIIKQTMKSSLDGEDASKKQSEDCGTSSTECDDKLHEHVKQKVGKAFPCPGEEHVSEYAQLEFYNRNCTFLETCSRFTNIAGMPSKSPENEERSWLKEQTIIWRKQLRMKDMLPKHAPEDDLNFKNEMAPLTPSCPKEATSPGFPCLSPKGLFFNSAMRLNSFPFVTSVSNITKEDEPFTPQQELLLSENIETELCVMAVSVKEENTIKLRIAATQSVSKDSFNPGVMSVQQPMVGYHGSDNIAILGSYPKTSPVEGNPSLVQNNFTQNWATNYEPTIIKKPKRNTVIENPLCDYEVRIMTLLAPTCPKQACTSGFPSALTPTLIYNGSSSINALPSCPAVSTIIGFPSLQKVDSKDWKPNHQPLWGKVVIEETVFLLQKCKMRENAKEGVFLAPTCPWQSLIPGFPSFPKASNIKISMINMVSLSSLCTEVSQIAGFPSFHSPKGWTTSKKPLFEPRVIDKHKLLNAEFNRGKMTMKGIVSLVPSCPKVSSIKGFPTIPHPKIEYYQPNMISLLPLCPIFSATPGLSSLEGKKGEGWTSDQGSLMFRPQKIIHHSIIHHSIDLSLVYLDKPKNMILLTCTCPRESVILGCPSVGQFKMPAVCSEHSSFEEAPKFQLPSKPFVSYNETSKTIVSSTETLNQDDKTTKNIYALEPSFLKPSRIHRASFRPKHKSHLEHGMVSFVPCCSSISQINGLASLTAVPCPEWFTEMKPVYVRTQVRHSILMALSGPKQLDYFNRKCMVTSVISCPKKARVYGLAQKSNRSLDMISSHTFVTCTSCVPGFPSARRNSSESTQEQTWATNNKILFEKQQKNKVFLSNFPSKPYLKQEKKYMVAMASSCPHLSQIPGFPSYLQSNKLQTVCIPLSVSVGRHALQELPHAQSDPKDASVCGIPSSSVRSQHTELTCGESFKVFTANIHNTCFNCLFDFIYFHKFAL